MNYNNLRQTNIRKDVTLLELAELLYALEWRMRQVADSAMALRSDETAEAKWRSLAKATREHSNDAFQLVIAMRGLVQAEAV